jgi:hypothetical protein
MTSPDDLTGDALAPDLGNDEVDAEFDNGATILTPFDVEEWLAEQANEIRLLVKHLGKGDALQKWRVYKIGKRLIEVKKRVGRGKGKGSGKFTQWIKDEFGWSHSTAGNYMNVARCFPDEDQFAIVANSNMTLSALYELAEDRVSQKARDKVLKIATKEGGELVERARMIEISEQNPSPGWAPPSASGMLKKKGPRKSVLSQYLDDPVNFPLLLEKVIGKCFADPKKYAQLLDLIVKKCLGDPDKLALARERFKQPAASKAP